MLSCLGLDVPFYCKCRRQAKSALFLRCSRHQVPIVGHAIHQPCARAELTEDLHVLKFCESYSFYLLEFIISWHVNPMPTSAALTRFSAYPFKLEQTQEATVFAPLAHRRMPNKLTQHSERCKLKTTFYCRSGSNRN